MNNNLLKLAYIRKKERKSLFFVILILLISSFADEAYFLLKQRMTPDHHLFAENLTDVANEPQKDTSLFVGVTEKVMHFNEKKSSQAKSKTGFTAEKVKERKLQIEEKSPDQHGQKSTVRQSNVTAKPIERPDLAEITAIVIDPNQPKMDDLRKLGLSSKVASNWIKYTEAGGTFATHDQLKKIYGLEEEEIQRISNHLKFQKVLKPSFNRSLPSIYMNQASAHDYAKIPGIGPVLSERIIKFREQIGGFYRISQLTEVYGIDPELIEKHKSLFIIEKGVRRININTCDDQELGGHSYCSYRTAKAIINYREQHGDFKGKEDLLRVRIINQDWVERISPYLLY